jgi:hypothetical protein
MTDRHCGYIVTLEKDIRDDDAKDTITALRNIKGVVSVEPILGGAEIHIATARMKQDLLFKVWNFIKQETS